MGGTLVVPIKKPNPGSRGGIVASQRLSPEQRSARGQAAANALLRKYGIGYFSALGKSSKRKRLEQQQAVIH